MFTFRITSTVYRVEDNIELTCDYDINILAQNLIEIYKKKKCGIEFSFKKMSHCWKEFLNPGPLDEESVETSDSRERQGEWDLGN